MTTPIFTERQDQIYRKGDQPFQMSCNKDSLAGAVSQRACVFCGSRVVLYPIADALHLVHGPIGCAAYTWDIRGALSSGPALHRLSFSTDLQERDVIFGGEEKLERALLELIERHDPKGAFVYSTCIVGIIGDDLEAVCRRVSEKTGIPVLPVQSEGFKGNKRAGYNAACKAMFRLVGTGDTSGISPLSINILGDFNLAGEIWIIREYFERMGLQVVANITGDGRIADIQRAHGAALNAVQCSGSTMDLALMMKDKYDIPFVRVSYFGIEDMAESLYTVARFFADQDPQILERTQMLVKQELAAIYPELRRYRRDLEGKKAAIYVGGAFKAFSLVKAFRLLGMDVVMVGSQTGTEEDYRELSEITDEGTIIVDDSNPLELSAFLQEKEVGIFVGGVKERPIAHKLGVGFCDHNHERKEALAGFVGMINFAKEVHASVMSPVWRFVPRSKSKTSEAFEDMLGETSCKKFPPAPPSKTPSYSGQFQLPPRRLRRGKGHVGLHEGYGRNVESPGTTISNDRSFWGGVRGGPFCKKDLPGRSSLSPTQKRVEPYVSTTNACKLCKPLGAALAFRGIEGAVPFLHGSQGCATYMRRYIISHFREPMDIASSSLGEKHAVYGGGPNLKLGIKNVMTKYRPALIGIATTCLTETIGDDVPMIVNEFKREFGDLLDQHGNPEIVRVSTPSYSGSHMEGFHAAVKAAVEQLAQPEPKHQGVGLFPGFVSPADIRYLREILDDFSVGATVLPDISLSLDGPALNEYENLPRGGTPVSEIKKLGGASAVIEFGRNLLKSQTAGRSLEKKFDVPLRQLGTPIGLRETDAFFSALEDISGRPTPAKHNLERGQLIDSFVDGHKYVFGKRVVVYGEEDLVVGITSFLAEIGLSPVLCATGGRSGRFEESIQEVLEGFSVETPVVREGMDFHEIAEEAESLDPDLLIGNSKGYHLARRWNLPLIRVGFPIHDRFGGHRQLHLGYRGAQSLLDRIINTLIERKQEQSLVGYTYI